MNILIAGDFTPRYGVKDAIEHQNYEAVFGQIKKITDTVDYSVVNLESPIVKGQVEPIEKTGLNLRCDENVMDAIAYAGFDCVTLANNHFLDYGDKGVSDTIRACESRKVDFVGGGENLAQARRILYKEIGGKKFAFVNFCENEWSIATETTGGSAPLDIVNNYYDISTARKHSDFVIVIIHGGREGYQLPTPRMQKEYQFFIDAGADVVVNHHQHCFSGYEKYNGKYIFYGLGNFSFDVPSIRKDALWTTGCMVKLDFSDGITFELIPYKQNNEQQGTNLMSQEQQIAFFEQIEKLNAIIGDSKRLDEEFEKTVLKDKNFLNAFEPYGNRYLTALYVRGLLPSFLSAKKKRIILNLFRCETHREVLYRLFSSVLKK